MAWEYRHGKTKKYYYKSRKVNGKVKKTYYGSGITAELFAYLDAERKFRLEQARIERERLDELDRQALIVGSATLRFSRWIQRRGRQLH
jgi:hypothetical protein